MTKSVPEGFIEHPIYNNIQGEYDQNGLEEATCPEAIDSNK